MTNKMKISVCDVPRPVEDDDDKSAHEDKKLTQRPQTTRAEERQRLEDLEDDKVREILKDREAQTASD